MANLANPAAATDKKVIKEARKRVPVGLPSLKLTVPEIEGFKCYWFLDRNVSRALQGGYEAVHEHEVPTQSLNVASDSAGSGNLNLGSAIKIWGGYTDNGQIEYLNLMKIKDEWWTEDHDEMSRRDAERLAGVFKGEQIIASEGVSAEDKGQRYVKTALFQRPARKGNV